ncbi:MAG: alanine racemase [Clostridia bacterium]|nr:alanine racemase [Clostridia bacterium]
MKYEAKRTWAEIDIDALKHNIEVIKKHVAPGAEIMGVVKADACGHGAVAVVKELLKEGVNFFAVSMLDEAVELRNAGIQSPILILSDNEPECAETIVELDIRQGVYSVETAQKLSDAAVKIGKTAKIHIKIDSGMGRVGFLPDAAPDMVEVISKMPNMEIEGIFTHFAVADEYSEESNKYTQKQYNDFYNACERIKNEKHINIPIRHAANSAAILRFPHMHLDMVRAGIILYGLWPSEETKATGAELKAVMTLKSAVSFVKKVDKGCRLSYGLTYCAPQNMTVATIPAGYADGYMRIQSNKGFVFHERSGKALPVAGRICMDQMMVDASNADETGIFAGDTVVLFGGYDGKLPTAEGIAKIAGTINYEVSCAVSRRVPRVYIENGKIVNVINRLTNK